LVSISQQISLQKRRNSIMITTGNLGYPRIGLHREMKRGLESYWKKEMPDNELNDICEVTQISNWNLQQTIGIDHIPSNDFSLYDHVLDAALMVGAFPERFQNIPIDSEYGRYFACARGTTDQLGNLIPPLEMTKWFNTNYHYLVPEMNKVVQFTLNSEKSVKAFRLAKSNGITTRPVILGPVTFLSISKSGETGFLPIQLIDQLIPIYLDLLNELFKTGVEWLQLDEPVLCTDLSPMQMEAYQYMFTKIGSLQHRPKILLTSYFADQTSNKTLLKESPFEGLHLDLIHSKIEDFLDIIPPGKVLSLGVINGRNVWCANRLQAKSVIEYTMKNLNPSELIISPSCSLMHIPQDISLEQHLPEAIAEKMAFAKQKLEEINSLKQIFSGKVENTQLINQGNSTIPTIKNDSDMGFNADREKYKPSGKRRKTSFAIRKIKQKISFNLPILPATSIGSFPQTQEVRIHRAKRAKKEISQEQYSEFIKTEIRKTIKFQEELGFDVLVHGEFERNDMVQYFAEMLTGFAFTENGWVQSFGSRYVRPPIIHDDVSRPKPMTIEWSKFAQSLTEKPVKGMLTGPVTILKWSFARDDQPEEVTCQQIAGAIRDEVKDLEKAGIHIIQIDEPAFREGLPLQKAKWKYYLDWAVDCFKIASSDVQDETQIHTHMCYAEFNEIMEAIAEMDADVISIEASRSGMDLLDAFKKFNYPNDVGPGVYDIHSPEAPSKEDMIKLIKKAADVIPADHLWVNPDCGLKTRQWAEITPALTAMMEAVKSVRKEFTL